MAVDNSQRPTKKIYSKELSHDTLFEGELTCYQHVHGYRFSVDSILLAHFIQPKKATVLDLGAGCGVISLILAYRNPRVEITCLEIQGALCELIRMNISENSFEERVDLVQADFKEINKAVKAGSFDFVVCNPPYYQAEKGRKNPGYEQAVARHQLETDLDDVIAACNYAVRTKGKAALIYPAAHLSALISKLKNSGLEPKRLQSVYPYPGVPAKQVLVEAVRCGGEELCLMEPFYMYNSKQEAKARKYSSQMQQLYSN